MPDIPERGDDGHELPPHVRHGDSDSRPRKTADSDWLPKIPEAAKRVAQAIEDFVEDTVPESN